MIAWWILAAGVAFFAGTGATLAMDENGVPWKLAVPGGVFLGTGLACLVIAAAHQAGGAL